MLLGIVSARFGIQKTLVRALWDSILVVSA